MTPAELETFLQRQLARAEGKRPNDPCATLVGRSFKGMGVRPILLDRRENGENVYSLSVAQSQRLLTRLKESANGA